MYNDRQRQLDLRFSKRMRVGGVRLTGNLDISNVFNGSESLRRTTPTVPTGWCLSAIQFGRFFKFGGSWTSDTAAVGTRHEDRRHGAVDAFCCLRIGRGIHAQSPNTVAAEVAAAETAAGDTWLLLQSEVCGPAQGAVTRFPLVTQTRPAEKISTISMSCRTTTSWRG